MSILSDLFSTYVKKMQKLSILVPFSKLLEQILVRENKLTVRQLFTWNTGKSFNVIKMQLQPAGKPSLSMVRGVHSEKYPHPHDGHYHLH